MCASDVRWYPFQLQRKLIETVKQFGPIHYVNQSSDSNLFLNRYCKGILLVASKPKAKPAHVGPPPFSALQERFQRVRKAYAILSDEGAARFSIFFFRGRF